MFLDLFKPRAIISLFCSLLAASAPAAIVSVAKPVQDSASHLLSEFIFPIDSKPSPQCHASTLAETSEGLVAAWFGGTREKDPDVGIWVALHRNGKWADPVEVVDGSEGESQEYACWNPVLFQPRAGPLMLFYKVGPDPRSWWGMLITSKDSGKTWSTPRKLGTDAGIGHLLGPVKNKPIQLEDGTLLCPSSTEKITDSGEEWRVHFELSADLGETWEVVGPINEGDRFDAIQPSVLVHADGDLQLLCRTREGLIAQSWSKDSGRTWSCLTGLPLPNPNAGTDAVDLDDGRKLLVYNHATRTGNRTEGTYRNGRQKLNVATSFDGLEWTPVLTLEDEDSNAEFSYPAVIKSSDGLVHISYTYKRQSIKHVALDPAKLH